MSTRRHFTFAAAAVAALGLRAASPRIRVESIRRLFHNGEHNAFTDLIEFKGTYYLTFRTCPDGHMVHPTSAILVLASREGAEWREVHRFSVPKRDVRDPHFLIFQNKLYVYTGTWYCGDTSPKLFDMNQHLGYATCSTDGARWETPRMLEGTYGHYIWRAAAHGGKAYLCGRRKREFIETATPPELEAAVESALLESPNGFVFCPVGFFQETYGNETAFLFERDGSILAVARGGGNRNAQLLRSRAPYQSWQRSDLGRYIGGPLLARWGSHYLVGGRQKTQAGPRTVVSRLVNNHLEDLLDLPSNGDNSYPGFVAVSPTRAWLSYYSTHETGPDSRPFTAIYIADLRLET